MTTIRRALFGAAALPLLIVAQAQAQSAPVVTLVPAGWARWEISAYAGRKGVKTPVQGSVEGDWYGAAMFGASAARLVTRNVSVELNLARSGTATRYWSEIVTEPGGASFYRSQRHHLATTAASAGVVYQAFENRWFHPFAGGGLEVMHETRRSDASQQSPAFRNGLPSPLPPDPALPPSERQSTTVRPFAGAGFKVFVSAHAFLKTDVRVSLARGGPESATWRAGVGFEF